MARLVSDSKSVPVTLKAAVTKGSDYGGPHNTDDGFFGVPFEDRASGDVINIDVSQREFELEVPAGATAAKGDVLYLDATTLSSGPKTHSTDLRLKRGLKVPNGLYNGDIRQRGSCTKSRELRLASHPVGQFPFCFPRRHLRSARRSAHSLRAMRLLRLRTSSGTV